MTVVRRSQGKPKRVKVRMGDEQSVGDGNVNRAEAEDTPCVCRGLESAYDKPDFHVLHHEPRGGAQDTAFQEYRARTEQRRTREHQAQSQGHQPTAHRSGCQRKGTYRTQLRQLLHLTGGQIDACRNGAIDRSDYEVTFRRPVEALEHPKAWDQLTVVGSVRSDDAKPVGWVLIRNPLIVG